MFERLTVKRNKKKNPAYTLQKIYRIDEMQVKQEKRKEKNMNSKVNRIVSYLFYDSQMDSEAKFDRVSSIILHTETIKGSNTFPTYIVQFNITNET